MAYTNFIAAIDLGTSRMVGVVGTKNAAGALSIIACDTEGSGDAIHRGCVYNIEETARRIRRLISKLENKLEGARIGKVYVGIDGQSLRSIEHNVSKLLGSEGVVTEEVLSSLRNECRKYHSDETVDVLAQESPIYFLDDKPVSNPLGLSGTRIEARYQLIVGRPSLRRNVAQSFERAKVGVAGYAIAPLALADILLSARDKEQGCALIDLGAGTTSLAVYKHGNLINLSVVPLGGDLITKDIESLGLSAQEAERVKLTYGSAISDKADADMSLSSTGSRGTRISLRDLNNVIEAREREILENVCACLARIRMVGSLGAGVTITGGAANLKRLPEMVRDIFKMEVCYPSIRRELMADEEAEGQVIRSGRVADKTRTAIVNIDTLSDYFEDGEYVDIDAMKARIPFFDKRATYVKVLARGFLTKTLEVEADVYSMEAAKMILLLGGKVIVTRKE